MPPSSPDNQTPTRAILVPFKTLPPAEQAARMQRLVTQAAGDQHVVLGATHLMMKGEDIIGYVSLGGLPTVQAWFDSRHRNAADSIKMIEHSDTIMRERGIQAYAVCCAAESPFTPKMERLGFTKLGTTVLWVKTL